MCQYIWIVEFKFLDLLYLKKKKNKRQKHRHNSFYSNITQVHYKMLVYPDERESYYWPVRIGKKKP